MVVLASESMLTMASLPYEVKSRTGGGAKETSASLNERSENYEKTLITQALEKFKNRQVDAAKYLKMDRSTLRYKMKKYGLLK